MTASISYSFFLGVALKSFIVLGVAWLAALLLRKSSASVRHLVWCAAFSALLALPLLSTILPALPVSIAGPLSPLAPIYSIDATTPALELAAQSGAGHPASPASISTVPDWRFLLLFAWTAGAAISVVQMCIGWGAMLHLRRKSRPFDLHDFETSGRLLGLKRAVPVLQAPAGSMPMTHGLRRPALYMPADATDWTMQRRRAVLLHELAHVRRRDHVTHPMARLALALYWWNPLARAAWREFLKEREKAADDVVLGTGECASDYANHLLEIARSLETRTAFGWTGVAAARRSQLEGRLLSILDSGRNRKVAGRAAVVAASLAALVTVVPVAATQASGRSASAALSLQNRTGAAADLIRQGDTAREDGKFDQAKAFYEKVLALSRTGPDAATALLHLGTAELATKQIEPAVNDFAQAQSADSAKAAEALLWTAIAREQQNNPEAAGAFFQSALAAADPTSAFAATIMDLYAQFLTQQGRSDEARSLHQQAAEIRKTESAQVLTGTPSPDVKRIGGEVKPPVLISKQSPNILLKLALRNIRELF